MISLAHLPFYSLTYLLAQSLLSELAESPDTISMIPSWIFCPWPCRFCRCLIVVEDESALAILLLLAAENVFGRAADLSDH